MKRFLILLLLAAAGTAQAKVTLPALFGDNMVLQQQREVRIWGESDAPQVVLTPSWSAEPVRAEVHDGRWEATIATPAGSFEPQTLTVADRDSALTLRNVLIGEVWICSGQSNMYIPLRGFTGQLVEEGLTTALASPLYRDRIRMITLPKREAETPQRDFEGHWTVPSPAATLRMSAVAYFFARTLTDALGVPVGIVSASWGGSKIEAWMDAASLRELGYDVERINADPAIEVRKQCCKLYNGLIAPVAGFAARGFVWYQGESNLAEADRYARLMERMTAYWRTQWGDDRAQMPLLYVQIAPHAYKDARGTEAALLVEAQADALALIPRSAMVSTTDVGEEGCIHPARKRPVGERLAAAALGMAYGVKLPDAAAVRFAGAEFADGKAIVRFDNARYGLTPRLGAVEGFELAGRDGVFHPAVGRVVPLKPLVEVTSEEVPEPVAVRYAFRNFTPATLANTLGMPVVPFRSDR
ncbi:sialate O-acetylesterase [Alistipes sp.]|uniref:sialate O-acetylesterase n=1 Tax=Alistipes sp. TaxID=1872444 RepID=UPI003AEF9CF1